MKVKLISITPDAEKTMLYCARVSNPKNQDSESTKLIDYCIKHGHWSILEMANMVIEIETSRAISAQILRHRSFSFQEFSQRYSKIQGYEQYEARSQDLKNRQNSNDDMSDKDKQVFNDLQGQVQNVANNAYEKALRMGVAKEQARFLLPMSTTSRLYMNGTIRSWAHYLNLRGGHGTQLEHMDIANAIKEIFKEELPIVAAALGY